MRNLGKILTGGILATLVLTLAMPTQAFYLEIPQKVLQNWTAVTGRVIPQVLGEKLLAQESAPENTSPTLPAEPNQPPNPQPDQNNQQPYQESQPLPSGSNENNPPANTCRVNGQDMPGDCSQYNNNQNQSQSGGPSPEQQARQLKDMQRGAKQMESNLKRLKTTFTAAEKKGIIISQEIKDRLAKAEEILSQFKNAQGGEDLQNVDLGELNQILADLEQARQEQVQAVQQLQNVKRDMKNLAKGIKMFETQITRLKKQKINPPVEITDTLTKVKNIITAVNNAKTWDEVESAGIEETQDLMDSLRESQQFMDMMARWPQTLKQLNAEINNLNRALKRDRTMVKNLSKRGIDLTENLAEFEAGIAKLIAVRDEATAKIKSGTADEVQAAFDSLQTDFFDQMEDTWSPDKTINTMGNLAQFQAQSKKELTQAQNSINKLKKQKIDTAVLDELLTQTKAKIAEVQTLAKAKPLDAEAVMAALDELSSLRGEFGDQYAELSGEGDNMPWQSGPSQFQNIQFNFNPGNYINQSSQNGPSGPKQQSSSPTIDNGSNNTGQQLAPGTE